MRALLLSAGFGTRLKPYTLKTPKCLIKINGKPLLDYWLRFLFNSGIKEVIINTHYHPEQVNLFIENSKYKKKITLVFEKELLGTAGTIINNRSFFKKKDFIVAHSDNLCICSFKDFIKSHLNKPKECLMTMMTFNTTDPSSCGIVELNNKNVVNNFYEKVNNPPSNLANAAVYIMSNKIFEFIESTPSIVHDISLDLIPRLKNKIYAWHNTVYNKDIGTPNALKEARVDINKYIKFIKDNF